MAVATVCITAGRLHVAPPVALQCTACEWQALVNAVGYALQPAVRLNQVAIAIQTLCGAALVAGLTTAGVGLVMGMMMMMINNNHNHYRDDDNNNNNKNEQEQGFVLVGLATTFAAVAVYLAGSWLLAVTNCCCVQSCVVRRLHAALHAFCHQHGGVTAHFMPALYGGDNSHDDDDHHHHHHGGASSLLILYMATTDYVVEFSIDDTKDDDGMVYRRVTTPPPQQQQQQPQSNNNNNHNHHSSQHKNSYKSHDNPYSRRIRERLAALDSLRDVLRPAEYEDHRRAILLDI